MGARPGRWMRPLRNCRRRWASIRRSTLQRSRAEILADGMIQRYGLTSPPCSRPDRQTIANRPPGSSRQGSRTARAGSNTIFRCSAPEPNVSLAKRGLSRQHCDGHDSPVNPEWAQRLDSEKTRIGALLDTLRAAECRDRTRALIASRMR